MRSTSSSLESLLLAAELRSDAAEHKSMRRVKITELARSNSRERARGQIRLSRSRSMGDRRRPETAKLPAAARGPEPPGRAPATSLPAHQANNASENLYSSQTSTLFRSGSSRTSSEGKDAGPRDADRSQRGGRERTHIRTRSLLSILGAKTSV